MYFPPTELMDQGACYHLLVDLLRRPDGLVCPRCRQADSSRIDRCHRSPMLDYRCGEVTTDVHTRVQSRGAK